MHDTLHKDAEGPLAWAARAGDVLLFLIPVVGVGVLLAFSAGKQDTPRRRFARANLCLFLMLTAALLLLLLTGAGVWIIGRLRVARGA